MLRSRRTGIWDNGEKSYGCGSQGRRVLGDTVSLRTVLTEDPPGYCHDSTEIRSDSWSFRRLSGEHNTRSTFQGDDRSELRTVEPNVS